MANAKAASVIAGGDRPGGDAPVPTASSGTWPDVRRELIRGWGRATGSHATMISPADQDSWHRLLRSAGPRGLIARGAGSGYGDCAQNSGGHVADTRLSAEIVIDESTSTAVVGAGVLLSDLMARAVPQGFCLPVLPGTAHVTVGGAIAADIHGKNHPSAGSIGAHIVDIDLLTPAFGEIGVGPNRQPDIFWATVGGLGLTGVIRRARIRLQPVATAWMWCRDTIHDSLDATLAGLRGAHDRHSFAAAWLDGHATGPRLGRGILTECWPTMPEELPYRARSRPRAYPTRHPLPIPTLPGRGIVRAPVIRTVNAAHLAVAGRRGDSRPRPIGVALHPLDATRGWPGLYGRNGLVQYQFAVPFGHESVLSWMLAETVRAGCPASLAVLKQLGPANNAPLSFPGPGWTLALDFPARVPGLAGLLDDADEMIAAAGGRIYLVKDSRLGHHLVPAMYPRLGEWREVRARLDPDGRLRSDLGRRLRLAG